MRDGEPVFWLMNRSDMHPAAKLTDDDVKLIRALKGERDKLRRMAERTAKRAERLAAKAKTLTAARVAEKFEVSHTTIFEIWAGKRR